jgi:prophage DNA circulation protein
MGRRIRRYSLTARFATNDHVARAGAFVAICESPGPGLLVHPTRGAVQVGCESARVSDELLDGYGVTMVELEFVEANDFLTTAIGSVFGTPITSFLSTVATNFGTNFTPSTAPFYEQGVILNSAAAQLGNVATELGAVLSVGAPQPAWAALWDVTQRAAVPVAAYDVPGTWTAVSNALAAIDRNGGRARYDAFKNIANGAAASSKLSPAAAVSENTLFASMRLSAAAYMARVASQTPASEMQTALERVDEINAILIEEERAAFEQCDPALHLELTQFRANTVAELTRLAFEVPARVVYHFTGPVCSHVAAYRIFGDAKRFRELELANPHQACWSMGPDILATKAAA